MDTNNDNNNNDKNSNTNTNSNDDNSDNSTNDNGNHISTGYGHNVFHMCCLLSNLINGSHLYISQFLGVFIIN